MKIAERFAEYGLTGGFFWLLQLAFLIILSPDSPLVSFEHWLDELSKIHIPSHIATPVGGLLAALAIVSIFFTGLLLDLLGSYYILLEMNVFRKNVNTNREWLDDFVRNHKSYIGKDYNDFLEKFSDIYSHGEVRRMFIDAINIFGLFSPKWWKRQIAGSKSKIARYRLMKPYSRLQSFLISTVLAYSGATRLDVLMDQMHLWRTSRAISTALLIFSVEISLILFPRILKSMHFILIVYFIVAIVSIFICIRAYSRMCYTLFALAYVSGLKTSTNANNLNVF